MGLNFKGSDASWSYSGFNEFRRRLGNEIGIDLKKMAGFGGVIPWNTIKDPLVPFLNHSDCEGHLSAGKLKRIVPRLQEIINKWDRGDWDRARTQSLIQRMEECIEEGIPLIFC
jgi:hypothetical protein